VDERDSTETPSLRKPRSKGEIEVSALTGALQTQSLTLFLTALANTHSLFLLFYECCRTEEGDRAGFLNSDNFSNQTGLKETLYKSSSGSTESSRTAQPRPSCVNVLPQSTLIDRLQINLDWETFLGSWGSNY